MSNIKSSKKDAITSKKKRLSNISRRSMVRTLIKKVYENIVSGSKEKAKIAFKKVQPILDRHVHKGLIHKNKSSRHKSNLMLRINNMV
ncbi:MAG: 30S ribosomal protein S20 [Buchnera aphidicola (Eriosoma harunire)]